MTTPEAQLAATLAKLEPADLPETARRAAKASLVDALAVMAAAVREERGAEPFHALALGSGNGVATMLAGGAATPGMAALANGALSHALDFEDTHDPTGMHPNAVTVPAVLALAEAENTPDDEVLLALAAGCDLTCRLTLSMPEDPGARGWYHPPMIGALGAAFACARLLQLPPPAIIDAVSLAAVQFSLSDELKRSPESHLRAFRDGFAARAAVEGALLARAGVRGALAPISGLSGVVPMLTGGEPRPEAFATFGREWLGTEVGIKLWPCCRGTHPFIALGLALAAEGLDPAEIASIAITTAPPNQMLLEPARDRTEPRTAIAAKFSIPFVLASTLLHGAPGLAAFDPEALGNAPVLALARRIRLDRCAPDLAHGGTITLGDGTCLRRTAPEPPMLSCVSASREAMRPKLSDCLGRTGAALTADALFDRIDGAGGTRRTLAAILRALRPG